MNIYIKISMMTLAYHQDIQNVIKYGLSAIKFGELLWINPRECIHWREMLFMNIRR